MEMMMMQMWFEATTKVTLWFKAWHIQTPLWYTVSCLGLFCLCLFQEALARYRAALARQYSSTTFQSLASSDAENSVVQQSPTAALVRSRVGGPTAMRASLSLLYALNVATSYLLMLAVMTFNMGYFAVIVVGLALGHFIFFPMAPGSSGSALSEACCPQT